MSARSSTDVPVRSAIQASRITRSSAENRRVRAKPAASHGSRSHLQSAVGVAFNWVGLIALVGSETRCAASRSAVEPVLPGDKPWQSPTSGYTCEVEWDSVMRVLAALEAAEVEYLVIGGVAVNFHGIARATEDLDLFIAPTADNIARLRTALHSIYDDPSIEEITADDLCGEYPAVRYVPPGEGPPMDILTRLGERFRFADLEGELYDVDGQPVRVATPATLYRMKATTVRPLDHVDAARLAEAFDLSED
jgi:hypothetical protein